MLPNKRSEKIQAVSYKLFWIASVYMIYYDLTERANKKWLPGYPEKALFGKIGYLIFILYTYFNINTRKTGFSSCHKKKKASSALLSCTDVELLVINTALIYSTDFNDDSINCIYRKITDSEAVLYATGKDCTSGYYFYYERFCYFIINTKIKLENKDICTLGYCGNYGNEIADSVVKESSWLEPTCCRREPLSKCIIELHIVYI